MPENEASRRPSLLARLLRRRPGERETAGGPDPPLLDQVSGGELTRLGADRLGPEIHLPAEGAARTAISARRRPELRRAIGRGLPFLFLGFGAVMVAGMSFGTVSTLADEGGPSTADILRLAVMGLVSLTVVGQSLAVFRSLPGGRWLAAQVGRPWQRLVGLRARASAGEAASAGGPPLLDQVSTIQLMGLASRGLGEASPVARAARRGWRAVGAGGWFSLVLAVMALMAFSAFGLALSVILSLAYGGGLGIGLGLQIAFLAMVTSALVLLGRTALRSMTEVGLRRPIRLLRRLARYLLRWIDSGSSTISRASELASASGNMGLRLAATALATTTVAGLAFAPPLIEGDGGAPLATGPTPTPAVAAVAPAPTPTPEPTPTPTPAPTPTPTDPFIGTWDGVDLVDGSNITLSIASGGDGTYDLMLFDDRATGACPTTEGPASLIATGTLRSPTVLYVEGLVECPSEGTSSPLIGDFTYDSATDTLTGGDGTTFNRAGP